MRTSCLALFVLLACARDDARAGAPTPVATPTATPTKLAEPTPPEPVVVDTAAQPEPTPPPVEPANATAVRLVDVDPSRGSLREQIVAAAAQAKADGRSVAVELWASWCPPCKQLDRLLRAGPVADAAAASVLIRVDTDVFGEELNALGYDAPEIPSLYHVDGKGKPRGKPMNGAKWSRASETAIAEQLTSFLAG